ncbi:MAG: hypothetical protein EHM47_01405 [Ignavibacteriales bacterium]|nr:MAG: hypothetical protein EHM47_01405 [Ignavibacteriales bacterium]
MSNIQSFLVIGAMSLLAILSLQFNSVMLGNNTFEVENKVYLTAFSLADDLIEEIKQKAFDERTIDFQAIAENQLTQTASLGKDGEIWPNFDDIDDYHNYTKNVDLPHAEGYNIISKINYAEEDGDDSANPSYFKKVSVTVSNEYLAYPVTISFIFSLHSKN